MARKPTPEKKKPEDRGIRRTCATMDEHRRLLASSPEYRRRRREIELGTRRFLENFAEEGLRTGVVRIPVVVHVVWNTPAQNVSDAMIQSQIDVLNADFRRTNADATNVPAHFEPFAADARLEFALAVRDPNCGVTTGVTRTNTATTTFTSATRNNVKSAATGGADPWPSDRYLNVWVANFSGLLGFGAFPGGPANLDGIVIATRAFGVGSPAANFDLGRTGTHEVGHWLNLLHIWGDDRGEPDECAGSDECDDTPNQRIETYDKPTGIRISCGNGPNGDMYMNYLDYVDDDTMIMFTRDQSLRMHAALAVERTGILASDGLVPVTGGGPEPDLWVRDTPDDTGAEPNPSTERMWASTDIWVRRSPNGLLNQDHQNPRAQQENFVYVRVRNRGCTGAGSQSGTLRLYWAKASSGLSWPAPWDGSVTSPALMGDAIGSQVVMVNGGEVEIVEFPWTPPDPADYAAFGADAAHFCLLARIETASAAPFGMTFPEISNLVDNVRNNNNIAWKNISIIDSDDEGGRHAQMVLATYGRRDGRLRLVFEDPPEATTSVFDWGHVLVTFLGDAIQAMAKGEIGGDGFTQLPDGRLHIAVSGAEIVGAGIEPGAAGTLSLQFVPHPGKSVGARVLELDVIETDPEGDMIGGQRFVLKTGRAPRARRPATQVGLFDGVEWTPKGGCHCC